MFTLQQCEKSILTLLSDIALIKNNAHVGAQIAYAYAQLKRDQQQHAKQQHGDNTLHQSVLPRPGSVGDSGLLSKMASPVVVGGAVIDMIAQTANKLILSTSNPGMHSLD